MRHLLPLLLTLTAVVMLSAGAVLAPPKSECLNYNFGSANNYFLGNEGACEEVYGGGGQDRLFGDPDGGSGLGDYLYGQDHDDTLAGGSGNDYVGGGSGNDGLAGNEGDDTIGADDNQADNIDCGPGTDRVYRDFLSTEGYVRNCETHIVNGG